MKILRWKLRCIFNSKILKTVQNNRSGLIRERSKNGQKSAKKHTKKPLWFGFVPEWLLYFFYIWLFMIILFWLIIFVNADKISIKKTTTGSAVVSIGCGGKTRTSGLWVMSPTSCQLLYPAIYIQWKVIRLELDFSSQYYYITPLF